MARTTNKRLENLLSRLAALTGLPLVIESHNPGDYTRYRVYTKSGDRGGVSEYPYGHRSYRKGELDEILCVALSTAEAVLPDDVVRDRMTAYWDKRCVSQKQAKAALDALDG